jgi:hypothetical protein
VCVCVLDRHPNFDMILPSFYRNFVICIWFHFCVELYFEIITGSRHVLLGLSQSCSRQSFLFQPCHNRFRRTCVVYMYTIILNQMPHSYYLLRESLWLRRTTGAINFAGSIPTRVQNCVCRCSTYIHHVTCFLFLSE